VAKGIDVAENLVAERPSSCGGFGAELGHLFAEMAVEAFGAGVGAGNLRGEIGSEQLCEAWVGVFRCGCRLADEDYDQSNERDELEGQESVEHFGFPSLVCEDSTGRRR
jgi:hypothetical protein